MTDKLNVYFVTVPVYQCEHCKKISTSKGGMVLHERRCIHNPNIRPLCWTCKNCRTLFVETEEIEYFQYINYEGDEHYGRIAITPNICDVRKCKMYSKYKIHNDNLETALIDNGYVPCPTESEKCEHYQRD